MTNVPPFFKLKLVPTNLFEMPLLLLQNALIALFSLVFYGSLAVILAVIFAWSGEERASWAVSKKEETRVGLLVDEMMESIHRLENLRARGIFPRRVQGVTRRFCMPWCSCLGCFREHIFIPECPWPYAEGLCRNAYKRFSELEESVKELARHVPQLENPQDALVSCGASKQTMADVGAKTNASFKNLPRCMTVDQLDQSVKELSRRIDQLEESFEELTSRLAPYFSPYYDMGMALHMLPLN